MTRTTINVEQDVRRRYNRRIFCCVRVKAAGLCIGLWDLILHSVALYALIVIFRRASNGTPTNLALTHDSLLQQPPFAHANLQGQPSDVKLNNPSFVSNNLLLNRVLKRRNGSRSSMASDSQISYSSLNSMGIKWAQSLTQQDKCIVFFAVFSVTMLIIVYVYGILKSKPSYIVPYFLVKVFNVIISIFSMLGFYAYLPDITVWLRAQSDFPLKNALLELDTQTLQLLVFVCLLFIVFVKVYIAAVVWYCYGYITALVMARSIGTITGHNDFTSYPALADMYSPPKYEEAIRSNPTAQEIDDPPPYTPLLSSTI